MYRVAICAVWSSRRGWYYSDPEHGEPVAIRSAHESRKAASSRTGTCCRRTNFNPPQRRRGIDVLLSQGKTDKCGTTTTGLALTSEHPVHATVVGLYTTYLAGDTTHAGCDAMANWMSLESRLSPGLASSPFLSFTQMKRQFDHYEDVMEEYDVDSDGLLLVGPRCAFQRGSSW